MEPSRHANDCFPYRRLAFYPPGIEIDLSSRAKECLSCRRIAFFRPGLGNALRGERRQPLDHLIEPVDQIRVDAVPGRDIRLEALFQFPHKR
jgi:hypothetical protein